MTTDLTRKYFHVRTNQLAKVVVLCWFAGLIFGTVLAYFYRSVFSSLMCIAVMQPVSIVGLLVCTVFPFALFVFAYCNRKHWIVCFLCFYKSFSHFFCAAIIMLQYQSAGWLAYILIMFADTCVLLTILMLQCQKEQLEHRYMLS